MNVISHLSVLLEEIKLLYLAWLMGELCKTGLYV